MKKMDGSLTVFDDGSEIFTPYDHNPAKNSPWINLTVCDGVTISATKRIVKLHLTFKRKPFKELSGTILGLVSKALHALNTKTNMRLYDNMLKAAEEFEEVKKEAEEESHEAPATACTQSDTDVFDPARDCFAY